MARGIRTESLSIEIGAALEAYADDVAEDLKREAKEVAKEAVKKLKETSPVGRGTKGHYKDGWTSKVESDDASSINIVIYNKKKPGLTHLLEKGHAKRGGGRVEGIPHIAPVEKWAEREYADREKARLSQ